MVRNAGFCFRLWKGKYYRAHIFLCLFSLSSGTDPILIPYHPIFLTNDFQYLYYPFNFLPHFPARARFSYAIFLTLKWFEMWNKCHCQLSKDLPWHKQWLVSSVTNFIKPLCCVISHGNSHDNIPTSLPARVCCLPSFEHLPTELGGSTLL